MGGKAMQETENMISVRKIWKNIKKYWWICVLFLLAYGLTVAKNVWSAYQADVRAAQQDTYQASGMVYYPHADEEEGKFFVALCTTERVVDRVNGELLQNGFDKYGSEGDSIEVHWIGNTFGLTLLGEGQERMSCMMDAFLRCWLEEAQAVSGKEGSVLNDTSVRPCVVKENGSVVVYEDPSQRQAGISLGDIITWRRLMIAAAAFFAGVLVIFVLIVFDERIRTKEEIEEWMSAPCLGILHICHVAFVTWRGKRSLEETLRLLSIQAEYEVLENVSKTPEAMKRVVEEDCIILGIYLNQDKRSDVKQTLEELGILGSNILGYLLFD